MRDTGAFSVALWNDLEYVESEREGTNMNNVIKDYIFKCDEVLEAQDSIQAEKLIDKIISVFGNQIKNIEHGLDTYSHYLGEREYDYLGDIEKLRDKLSLLFAQTRKNEQRLFDKPGIVVNNTNTNTNTNRNTVNVDVSVIFQKARGDIETNESLSELEIQEVLQKINEIEEIYKSKDSINKKWFSLRPTMEWLGTKGLTIATTILNLIRAVLAA